MENKILMICPYFGKIPSYFQLWALSAGFNSEIHFLILCDFDIPVQLPPNIEVIKMSFSDVQLRIKTMFDKAKINRPYKLWIINQLMVKFLQIIVMVMTFGDIVILI